MGPGEQNTMRLAGFRAPGRPGRVALAACAGRLTLLVLTVVAVPLAKTEPRRGRFSGLAAAILVYVIYANLLAAGRGWLERPDAVTSAACGGCMACFWRWPG